MKRRHPGFVILLLEIALLTISCEHDVPKAARDRPAPPTKRTAWLEKVNAIPIEELRVGGRVEPTRSGIATRLIKRGDGQRRATLQDAVVLYSQVYDTSGRVLARGQNLIGDPANDLNRAGREALTMMVEGEVRRIWFPDPKSPRGVKVTDYEIVWISPQK